MGEEVDQLVYKNKLKLIGFIVFVTIGILSFLVWALVTEDAEAKYSYKVPEWVKANAGWWSEGHITDQEFSYSLQWLFDNGLVEVRECTGRCL